MNEKKEYIERALLRESFNEVLPDFWGEMRGEEIFAVIDSIAPADVAPVVHGEWKPYRTPIENRQSGWICTNCSGVQYDLSNGDTDYCPHCGARMDGGQG